MSGEEPQKDFIGFAQDLQQLRFTLRSALGLSPQRPLERMRMNTQAFGERLRPQAQPQGGAQPRREPQGDPPPQGQRTRMLPRPFGILDALLTPQQPQQEQPRETPPEELAAKRKTEEEWHVNELKRLKGEELERVKNQSDFSIVE